MSLRDLDRAGMLLPREQWGKHDLHTTVNRLSLIGALLLGVVSIVLMYAGDGRGMTMLGMVLFLTFMAWITWISVRAVDVQEAQFSEELERLGMESPADASAEEDDAGQA